MSWTQIDYSRCTGCTICAQICAGCYHMENERMISQANERTCVICGKCVAICPEDAITHTRMDMTNFPPIAGRKLIETADLVQFIRERRAHRIFKNKQIAQVDLEKLVDVVRYAPTGHNAMDVEIIVAREPRRIKELSNLAVDYQVENLKNMGDRIRTLKEANAPAAEIAALEGRSGFPRMIVNRRDAGKDPILYQAGAVMIFHAPANATTPKDDCVIAAVNMGLLARTMGLETTFIAMFEWAANAYLPLQQALNLPQGHKVYSVLAMGYPQFKYQRVPDRRSISVRWE